NIDHVYAWLAKVFETRTTGQWIALLEAADVPVMPVNDLEALLVDPHLSETGFFRTVEHPSEGPIRTMRVAARWSETDPAPAQPAPQLGEHGVELLREAGYDDALIHELIAAGVLRGPISQESDS